MTTILDAPPMHAVRQQFLYLPISPDGFLLAADWSEMQAGRVEGEYLNANQKLYPLARRPWQDLDAENSHAAPATIPALLTWTSRIPRQLVGREAEMADLQAWAAQGGEVRLRVLWGGGGVGKTRLAVESGEAMRFQDWGVCLLRSAGAPAAMVPGVAGMLLIVDYPEQQPAALQNLLRMLKNGSLPAGRWRVLFPKRCWIGCCRAESHAGAVRG